MLQTSPSTFTESFSTEGLSNDALLALVFLTFTNLNWRISHLTPTEVYAHTLEGFSSFNVAVKATINADRLQIQCTLQHPDELYTEDPSRLIPAFIAVFNKLNAILTKEELFFKFQEMKTLFPALNDASTTFKKERIVPKFKHLYSIFIPQRHFFITPLVVNINILMFLAMIATGVNPINPSTESLIRWGANAGVYSASGQWWRLLTCVFLHIGIAHLAANMVALFLIGNLLEPLLGKGRFLLAYLLCGITASLTSFWWHTHSVSAGASGAIFGMYGIYIALLSTNLLEKKVRKPLLLSMVGFVVYTISPPNF